MENWYKIPALLLVLFLCVSMYLIGCRLPADNNTPPDEKVCIIIEPCFNIGRESDDKEPAPLVTFKELSLEASTLDRGYDKPGVGTFRVGEPCFLLLGIIENGHDEGSWVAYHATGYDDSGNTVSYTLDAGPIVGVAQEYIDGKSAVEFTLHLSWSDNASIFKIRCQISDVMFP